MSATRNYLDRFAAGLARTMVNLRWLVIFAAIAGAVAVGSQATKLEFSNNYRVFFSKQKP